MRRGRLVGYVLLAGALSMGMLYIGMKNLAVFQVEHVELESRVVEALLERTSVANRPPLKDLLDEYGNITGAPEDLEKCACLEKPVLGRSVRCGHLTSCRS